MSDPGIGEAHRSILNGLDALHVTGHAVSFATLIGALAGVLPALAALGAVIWYGVSIYETKTVQRWLRMRRRRKSHRRVS